MVETYLKKTTKAGKEQAEAVNLLKKNEKQVLELFKSLTDEPKTYKVGKDDVKTLADKIYNGDTEQAKEVLNDVVSLGQQYTSGKMNYAEYTEAVYNTLYKSLYTTTDDDAQAYFDFFKKIWDIPGIRGDTDIIHKIVDAARIGIEALYKAIITIAGVGISMQPWSIYELAKSIINVVQKLDSKRNLRFATLTSQFNTDGNPGLSFGVFIKKEDF